MALIGSYYGKPNKTIHINNVRCRSDEQNIQQCSKTEYGLKEVLASDVNVHVAGVSCVPNAAVTATNAPISNIDKNITKFSATTISTIILACILAIVLIIRFIM